MVLATRFDNLKSYWYLATHFRNPPPHMACILHTRADKALVYCKQLCGGKKLLETIQNA